MIRVNIHRGFTLIEVAIVMLILGVLLAAVITPMGAQRESNKIKMAQRELKSIEEALYGFAIASDRPVFIDVASVLALVSFLGTVAFAAYVERRA